MKNIGVVIVAAGPRFPYGHDGKSKQYLPLAGKPILIHTLLKFLEAPGGTHDRTRRSSG